MFFHTDHQFPSAALTLLHFLFHCAVFLVKFLPQSFEIVHLKRFFLNRIDMLAALLPHECQAYDVLDLDYQSRHILLGYQLIIIQCDRFPVKYSSGCRIYRNYHPSILWRNSIHPWYWCSITDVDTIARLLKCTVTDYYNRNLTSNTILVLTCMA